MDIRTLRIAFYAILIVGLLFVRVTFSADFQLEPEPVRFRLGVPISLHVDGSSKQNGGDALRIIKSVLSFVKKNSKHNDLIVQLAYGNQYQLLDWLESEQIDAALLSTMAGYLLTKWNIERGEATEIDYVSKDNRFNLVPLSSLESSFFPSNGYNSEHVSVAIKAVNVVDRNKCKDVPKPVQAYQQIISRIIEDKQSGAVLLFPSYLSTSGFLAPISLADDFIKQLPKHESLSKDKQLPLMGESILDNVSFVGDEAVKWSCEDIIRHVKQSKSKLPQSYTVIQFAEPNSYVWKEGNWKVYRFFSPKPFEQILKNETNPWLFSFRKDSLNSFPETADIIRNNGRNISQELIEQLLRSNVFSGNIKDLFAEPYENRIYRFKPLELINLIRSEQERTKDDDFALVLPGGGVKAAYQTVLIDDLYEKGLVKNIRSHTKQHSSGSTDPLLVKYISGNSGGALLGSFVSSLGATDKSPGLEKLLWKNKDDEPLSSLDVFPFVDLMRWLAVFAGFVVFILIVSFMYRPALSFSNSEHFNAFIREKRAKIPKRQDDRSRLPVSMYFITCLGAMPFLFKIVNGPHGAEHVPALAGFFYFLCLSIAAYADNTYQIQLKLKPSSTETPDKNLPRLGVRDFILLAVSLLLILLPVYSANQLDQEGILRQLNGLDFRNNWFLWVDLFPFGDHISVGSLSLCIGSTLLITSGLVYVDGNPYYFNRINKLRALSAYVLILATPFVLNGLLFAWKNTGSSNISILEITGEFWRDYLILVFIATMIILLFGTIRISLDNSHWRNKISSLLYFINLPHPSRIFPISHGGRILIFAFFGWIWWNIVVAPGLYGNDNAQGYLLERMNKHYGAQEDNQDAFKVPLQTIFITPSVSLATGIDRYTIFFRSDFMSGSEPLFPMSTYNRLEGDIRWRFCEDPTVTELMNLVFASGSPFPIFPAHRVEHCYSFKMQEEKRKEELEWMIDGGFAHNVPIEALRLVGAKQLLVIESTPDKSDKPDKLDKPAPYHPHKLSFSLLAYGLPRLIPFLFERSQLQDKLNRKGMFVAEIYPNMPSDGDWPLLTSFQTKVIETLTENAKNEKDNRIGKVSAWGIPIFTHWKAVKK